MSENKYEGLVLRLMAMEACAANEEADTLAEAVDAISGLAESSIRLIAAAPDLFEALKELVNWWENDGGDLNVSLATARAAIAKAT